MVPDDFKKFIIDKNIPLHKKPTLTKLVRDVMDEMVVGDSFSVPLAIQFKSVARLVSKYSTRGCKFICSSRYNRVWRIK